LAASYSPVVAALAISVANEKVSLTIAFVYLLHSSKLGVQRAAHSNLLIVEHSYQQTGPAPLNLF